MDFTSVFGDRSRRARRRRAVTLVVGLALVLALLVSVVSLALASGSTFPDVPVGNPYYAAITELAYRGVIGGFDDGSFRPGALVTRQQFAKMVVLAGGYPVSESDVCPFRDVSLSGPGTLFPDNYVAVCAAHGITTGKTPTTFDPYATITRYQVVSMVVRAADDLKPGLLGPPSASFHPTASWQTDALHGPNAARAEYNGLLTGLDLAQLNPAGYMTRGEVAQVLYNLLLKLGAKPITGTAALSTSVASGSGSVTISPDQSVFARGAVATLTALPAPGFVFAGWTGDATGLDNPLSLTMDADKSVAAMFVAPRRTMDTIGGYITSAPAACSRGTGMLDVFARSASGTLIHLSGDGITWSSWEDLGGTIKAGSDPSAVSSGPDRLDVFVRGADDALWHRSANGGVWSSWENLGGTLSASPAATYRDAGGDQPWLYVFAVGSDSRLRYRTYNGTTWSAWAPAGQTGPTPRTGFAPAAINWGIARIDLFLCATDGHLWYSHLPNLGDWSPWESVGGTYTSSPTGCSWWAWAEGRLDVFVRGDNNGLWHRCVISGLWSAWEDLGVGPIASAPSAVAWAPDRIDVFVRGTDNVLYHEAWTGEDWQP